MAESAADKEIQQYRYQVVNGRKVDEQHGIQPHRATEITNTIGNHLDGKDNEE